MCLTNKKQEDMFFVYHKFITLNHFMNTTEIFTTEWIHCVFQIDKYSVENHETETCYNVWITMECTCHVENTSTCNNVTSSFSCSWDSLRYGKCKNMCDFLLAIWTLKTTDKKLLWKFTFSRRTRANVVFVFRLMNWYGFTFFMPPPFEDWWRGIKCYPCPCVRSCVRVCVRACVRPLSKFGVRSITFERLHRFYSNLVCWYIISKHRSSSIWVTIH